ncbi:MAG: integrase [Oleiphilaceae bacterium]|jgi:integrase
MDTNQLPQGVRIRNSSIAIRFQYQGKRFEETWKVKPTASNLRRAAKMRQNIIADIRAGIFEFEEHFPDSRYASKKEQQEEIEIPTFWEVAESYFNSLIIAESTISEYKNCIKRHFYTTLGPMKIDKIRYSHLVNVLVAVEWGSMKTRNNVISPLRGVFKFAKADRLIDYNPAKELKFAKIQKPKPDPLSLDESELILGWVKSNENEVLYSFFEFAFFTGLRTSEMLAVSWKDVDWIKGRIRVDKARVKGVLKGTKTYEERDVELNSRALAALKRMKSHSFLRGEEIFINPNTNTPFITNKAIRLVWNVCLKKLGVRHRVSYQTRHTFCTLNLMAGANVMWVSKQMGHSNTQMTLTRYSAWIEQSDKASETTKLDAFVNQSGGKVGVMNVC